MFLRNKLLEQATDVFKCDTTVFHFSPKIQGYWEHFTVRSHLFIHYLMH